MEFGVEEIGRCPLFILCMGGEGRSTLSCITRSFIQQVETVLLGCIDFRTIFLSHIKDLVEMVSKNDSFPDAKMR